MHKSLFFMFLGCLIGCANVASALTCTTESVSGANDKYIFPKASNEKQALVCGSSTCSDGTVVFISGPHKIGNGSGKLNRVSNGKFYKCKTGIFDNKWQEVSAGIITNKCSASMAKASVYTASDYQIATLAMASLRDGYADALCRFDTEVIFKAQCTIERDGKYFVDKPAMWPLIWQCKDGDWFIPDDSKSGVDVKPCWSLTEIDSVDKPAPNDMKHISGSLYINTTKAKKIGDVFYEYSPDRRTMCVWGYDKEPFAYLINNALITSNNKLFAQCFFAKEKYGDRTQWEDCDDPTCCKCLNDGEMFDSKSGRCVKKSAPKPAKTNKTKTTEKPCENTVGAKECNGDYFVCNTDADCNDIEKLPPQATAGHCVSAGRSGYKVCTATACNDKWGVSQGRCVRADETTTPTPEQQTEQNAPDAKNDKQSTKANDAAISPATDANTTAKTNTPQVDSKPVKTVFDRIDEIEPTINAVKLSLWRDEYGKFNTARLASDSIAGVVLGTVGGVVTSVVMKKSQTKKGFEDIKCTINGQDVANFGDEFRISAN